MTPTTRFRPPHDAEVLIFSKTTGYRHASIPHGIDALQKLGAQYGFGVTATEDPAIFTHDVLRQYDAVIWLSTTGTVLNDAQRGAFEGYIRSGGGYVGIHAAADTEYEWEWYGGLVGAYFYDHPRIQTATVKIAGQSTPATRSLPREWMRKDEWYNFRSHPPDNVRVLAWLDESTYDAVGDNGGRMGAAHPLAWYQFYDGGRSFYTGMGHTSDSYLEPLFLSHLLGGIRMAAGWAASETE